MATPMPSMARTIAAIVQCSSREKGTNWLGRVVMMSLPAPDVGGRDLARLLRLAFTPGERSGVDRGASAQQGVVRGRDARGQNQGVEVDVGRGTGVLGLYPIDRHGSHVDPLPSRRPGDGGVASRIARLPDG